MNNSTKHAWSSNAMDITRVQVKTFANARQAFGRRINLKQSWSGYANGGRPHFEQFGHTAYWNYNQQHGPLTPINHLDHHCAYHRNGQLAVIVSWPYASVSAVQSYLSIVNIERFAWGVASPDSDAASVYIKPGSVVSWILADRTMCDAEAVVDAFMMGKWSAEFADVQRRMAAQLNAGARTQSNQQACTTP